MKFLFRVIIGFVDCVEACKDDTDHHDPKRNDNSTTIIKKNSYYIYIYILVHIYVGVFTQ